MGQYEIERKWLVDGYPDLPVEEEETQWQGYLSLEPAVRIRKIVRGNVTEFWLTVKGKGTLQRVEVEVPLGEDEYEALRGLAVTPVASKRMRKYRLSTGELVECSLVDEGEETAFYYAEVEFGTVEAAQEFTPPEFLGQEVTYEPGYTMLEYCLAKAK